MTNEYRDLHKVGTLLIDPTDDGKGLVDTIRGDDGFILVLDQVMSTGQMNFVIYEVEDGA